MGTRAGFDAVEKIKSLTSADNRTPIRRLSTRSLVSVPINLSWLKLIIIGKSKKKVKLSPCLPN
jgi:hypothetical protein